MTINPPEQLVSADGTVLGGWIDNPHAVEAVLSQLPMPMAQGNLPQADMSKDVFLYKIFRKATGLLDLPKGPQKIGDCVSWGWSQLINLIQAIMIATGSPVEYQEHATEVIYALSRCEVGQQWNSYEDGSVGAWAAKAVAQYGTLSRNQLESVLGPGKGKYDPNRAKLWGAKGLPDALEPLARQHLIKTVSMVTTVEDAVSALQNGYPIAICSNRGFTMTRDQDGFCLPRGTWNHCMIAIAYRSGSRPGVLILQSWGPNTPNGPLALEQPDNSFWCDLNTFEYILKQRDSFTASGYNGYPAQNLDYAF